MLPSGIIVSSVLSIGLFSQGQQEANRGLFTQSNPFGQNSQQHSSLFEQTKNTLGSTATASVQVSESGCF